MDVISAGNYCSNDGVIHAYAVVSAKAPKDPNFTKIIFGYRRSIENDYSLISGQLYNSETREWRSRIEALVPGTQYKFIAYSENAYGLQSTGENPTVIKTMSGANQLPEGLATIIYVDGEIDTLAGYVDLQDTELQSNIDNVGFPIPSELTIYVGGIAMIGNAKFRYHTVDTEAGAAADDLDTINGGNAGELLLIQAENAARIVTLKDGTSLKMEGDFTLESTEDKIFFICIASGVWHELTRSKVEGFPAPTELTIASGAITVSDSSKFRFHSVDTESDAATDDLDTVSGGNAGEILILQAENAARDVVCKDGASLKLEGDFTLDHTEDKIILLCISSGVWHELTRSNNGA